METVLILENVRTLRELYKVELEDEGYRVLQAGNSKEALRMIEERALDLIIADYQMFPTNSYMTTIQKSHKNKNIPVIIQTAYPPDPREYASYEMLEFIIKNSNLIKLKNKLREMLDYRNHN